MIELRTTSDPSERVRNALMGFINPELDLRAKDLLFKNFVLKSWHRQIISHQEYVSQERNPSSSLRTATTEIESLASGHPPLRLNYRLLLQTADPNVNRIFVEPLPNNTSISMKLALESIPSLEKSPFESEAIPPEKIEKYEGQQRMFFVEIAKSALAPKGYMAFRAHQEEERINTQPEIAGLYTATPRSLVMRELNVESIQLKSTPEIASYFAKEEGTLDIPPDIQEERAS